MSSINLYTKTTGGNRSVKTKDHPNPDIAQVIMTVYGVDEEISWLELHISPHKPIDHPLDLYNHISVYMEVTHEDHMVKYFPFILIGVAIDNPDMFYFTGDSLTITLGDNLHYGINPTRFRNTREEYPAGTSFKLVLTDSGTKKLNRYLDKHFKDYM